MRTCLNCKAEFEVERKRGRPHTKCEKCRKIPKTNPCLGVEVKLGPAEKAPEGRYSRRAFIEYMETYGVPIGSKAVAEAIRIVKEG